MTTDPVPLSAEEEASLRAEVFDPDARTFAFTVSEFRALFATLDEARATPSGDLAALKDRGWLKHTNGCSWEVRKDDGTKECNCGLIAALRSVSAERTEEGV